MLDRPCRRAAYGRRDHGRTVRRENYTRRAGARRCPDDGAEVPRTCHLIEATEQGALHRRRLPCVVVRIRRTPGDDALVIRRAGSLGELAFPTHARLRPFGEPGQRPRCTLPDPELEDGALPP